MYYYIYVINYRYVSYKLLLTSKPVLSVCPFTFLYDFRVVDKKGERKENNVFGTGHTVIERYFQNNYDSFSKQTRTSCLFISISSIEDAKRRKLSGKKGTLISLG